MEQLERIAAGARCALTATRDLALADYANHPRVELSPDSHEFIARAAAILAGGPLVDPIRLPGYPLVIALVWRLRGQPELAAVSAAQGLLFALAALWWLARWLRPRLAAEGSGDTRRERATLVGLVALVGLYGLVITTLGGYGDYARLHTAFAPLMLVVQWGGALGALASVTKRR